jgi:uncharacterized membrane protein
MTAGPGGSLRRVLLRRKLPLRVDILGGMRIAHLAPWGSRLFALSLVAFGIEQFLVSDFVPGRPPAWPAGLPGHLAWAYLTGAVFVVCGMAILFGANVRAAALTAGTLLFGWALLRQVPLALGDAGYGLAWTNLGKALALVGGALAVAGFLHVGRCGLGAFLASSGIQHFLFPAFVATLVPSWIPGATFWTYFAGVALILGGIGLVLPPTARVAGALSGLMIFSWVVVLHVPRAIVAAAGQARNEWTAVFEALACSGIAFMATRRGKDTGISEPARDV